MSTKAEKERLRKLNNKLKYRYGITLEEYNRMWKEQGGRCRICLAECKFYQRKLSVDHDHQSGEVRGLLCVNCNTGIGKFRDNVETLVRAIRYLVGLE